MNTMTPAVKPIIENPIIPDLKAHLEERLHEIVRMKPNEAKKYDTPFTWAVVNNVMNN